MHIYLILLLTEDAAVGERVQRSYPEAFKYNDTTFLVTDSSPITENIAIQVGIKGDDRVDWQSAAIWRCSAARWDGASPPGRCSARR